MSRFTLNPEGSIMEIGGREYRFIFNLKTIAKVQEVFDKPCGEVIKDLCDTKTEIETLIKLIPILCNRTKETITEEYVAEMVSTRTSRKIAEAILHEWISDLPEMEDTDPNLESGETES